LLENLDISGIIHPYELVRDRNGLALILEDIGGESLKQFFANVRLALSNFLAIAIQLATPLEQLHQHNIIHKDIKPKNVIIDARSRQSILLTARRLPR
jgi:serine/threonine protein kinase